ncbi:MAG: type II toxin-antitoxin system HipA family toxin [Geopsychrobacter sp.]|nr:type II toxin-antitoxin system HipA family toxin [Geopsychrobacter sp.]
MSGKFKPIKLLAVDLDVENPLRVGRLAYIGREILFEFDPGFPVETLKLSPFQLKTAPGSSIIKGPANHFEGLHGVFNDSLPDGWGRLLMERKLRDVGIRPNQLTPLDRLAWIGSKGMGALSYRPVHPALAKRDTRAWVDLDEVAEASRIVLEDSPVAVFDYLLQLGGSPHGARPKALIGLALDGSSILHDAENLPKGFEHWLVKFGTQGDIPEAGLIEQAYADMARAAGVLMSDTKVLASKRGPGYFSIKRFDRDGNRRIHMHSICGLLHADFRLPSIGYEELLKATQNLTRRKTDVEQMFRRMVFNVFAHNRDDHTKNHSFLMDLSGEWRLSPAYDITFSDGPGGEHALDIAGEGKNPGLKDIQRVGDAVGISKSTMVECVDQVRNSVEMWHQLADKNGIPKRVAKEIASVLNRPSR